MRSRAIIAGFAICLSLLGQLAVEGQDNTQQKQNQFQLPSNPVHEKAKNEAQDAHAKGDYAKAIELTTAVLRANSSDHVAYYLRAGARIELGQLQNDVKLIRDGVTDARQAISITRTTNITYYLPYLYGMTTLATVEGRKGHAEVSIKVANDVLKRTNLTGEERSNLLYQRAMAYIHLKDFESAVKDHEASIKSTPGHFGSRIGLAQAHAAAGNQNEAIASFGELVKAFPNNPQVYNDRGNYLQEIGRYDDAIVDFTRTIELDQNFTVGYINRGFALMVSGDPGAAQNDFTTALKIDPNQPMAYSLRGDSLLAQGRLEPAIADYKYVSQINPKDPSAYANLGFARFLAKDYDAVVDAFSTAINLDPQSRFLEPWRAWAMMLSGKSETAKKQFDSLLKKEASQRDWIDHLVVYALGGSSDEELLAAIHKDDQQVQNAQTCEAHYFIGQRKSTNGQSAEAASHYRQVVKTGETQLYGYRAAAFTLKNSR